MGGCRRCPTQLPFFLPESHTKPILFRDGRGDTLAYELNQSRAMLKVFVLEGSTLVRNRLTAQIESVTQARDMGEAEDTRAALVGIADSGADGVIVDVRLTGRNRLDVLVRVAQVARPPLSRSCRPGIRMRLFVKPVSLAEVHHFLEDE